MAPFDALAARIDWFEIYRPSSLAKVDLYADGAALECNCNSRTVTFGREAIAEYWRKRFQEQPAAELRDLRPNGETIVANYRVAGGVIKAILDFVPNGKVVRIRCGPGKPAGSRAKCDRYSWDLVCPVCGAEGIAHLSEDAFPKPTQLNFRVDELSAGFQLSKLGQSAADTEIICVKCGAET